METNNFDNSEIEKIKQIIKKAPYILDCNFNLIGDDKKGLLISYGKERTISLSDNQTLTIKPIDILAVPAQMSGFCTGFYSDYFDSENRQRKNIQNLAYFIKPYANHYGKILGEDWDPVKTANRFFEISHGFVDNSNVIRRNNILLSSSPSSPELLNKYLVVAYGDLDTIEPDGSHKIEEIPLGFFGCTETIRPIGKFGESIRAEELFVRPEFRGYHIGLDLVAAMFINARLNEIKYFEGISYADENGQPMKWWQKIGACDEQTVPNKDGLIIISGELDMLLNNIFNIQNEKKQPTP